MLRLLLSILGALAFTQAEDTSIQDTIEHTNSAAELPNVAPYNLMLPPSTPGYVHYPDDPDNIEFVSIPMRAVHKKARMVYKKGSKKEVIGFDLYLRGTPLSMSLIEFDENLDKKTSIILNLPISPNSWSSTEINHTYAEKTFTRREKYMKNKHADIYLRFRKPDGAHPKKTKALVDNLNKNCTTISGIETVNRLLAITNKQEIETISDAFEKGVVSSIYLDLEYDTLQVTEYSGWDSFNCDMIMMTVFFSVAIMFLGSLALTFLFLPDFGVIGDMLCVIGLGICTSLLQIIVWQCSIRVV